MSATDRNQGTRTRASFASAALVALLVALGGCKGDDGSDGAAGAQGAPGAPGESAPIRTDLDPAADLPGIAISILSVTGGTGTNGNFAAGDAVSVNFTVKTRSQTSRPPQAIPLDELDWCAILFSGPSFNYQRVLPQQFDVIQRSVAQPDGSWTYTFASTIPTTYAAPLNNPTGPYDTGSGVLAGEDLLQGTYTVGMEAYKNYTIGAKSYRDAGNATFDVLLGGASAIDRREVVTLDNCNECHTSLRAHGGIRRTIDSCVLCHTAGALDRATPGASVEFKVMIHRMHDAAHLPSVNGIGVDASGNRIYTVTKTAVEYVGYQNHIIDFTGLLFPVWPSFSINRPRNLGYSKLPSAQRSQDDATRKGVVDCAKCHDGAAQGDLAYLQPARGSCGSCHDDIDWGKKYVHNIPPNGMPAQANDATCNQCHAAGGGATFDAMAVKDAHKHPVVDPRFATGLNFKTTAVTGGTGAGGAFKTGDPIRMTFTLKDDAGNDLPIGVLDSSSSAVTGPTRNFQQVLPLTSPTGISSPFEGNTARLVAVSATGKGTMTKLFPSSSGALATEVVTVSMTSSTAFTIRGTVSGALGSGTLAASTSSNPKDSSIAGVSLSATCAAGNYTVAFTNATNFTVTGPGGSLGSGDVPAPTTASTRFFANDRSIAFNIAMGSTPATTGNTFHITVFRATGSTSFVFAIVVGRTALSTGDRYYYDAYAPAASYTMAVPMDIPTEFLGRGDGTAGQTLTAAMAPVYFGRQTLFERTATGTAALLVADSSAYGRFVDVAGSFAKTSDFGGSGAAVLDEGKGLGTEEYLTLQFVEPAPTAGNTRVWFRLPIRFNHKVSAGASLTGVTLTTRLEGVHYTLDATTGVVSAAAGFVTGNAIVLSYRTEARFGMKRDRSDQFQGFFQPPFEDSPALDEAFSDWGGKAFESGTYTLGLWGYRNMEVGGPDFDNEQQTYRMTSPANNFDFLFGSATELDPYKLLSYDAGRQTFNEEVGATCNSCHNDIWFHGGSRRGFGTCLICHGTSGAELSPPYDSRVTPASAGYGVSVQFRNLAHRIHAGEPFTNTLVHGPAEEEEVIFPSTVNGVIACEKCHGTTSEAWLEPSNRTHSTPLKGNLGWVATCGACHTSDSVRAHMAINTATFTPVGQVSPVTLEACEACHGPGAELSVELSHKIR